MCIPINASSLPSEYIPLLKSLTNTGNVLLLFYKMTLEEAQEVSGSLFDMIKGTAPLKLILEDDKNLREKL